jgi:hypothetical protein
MKLIQKIKLKRQKNKIMKELFTRLTADTPTFFKKVRAIGIIMISVGTALATAPVALPAIVVSMGGYLMTAGTIAGIIAQTAVRDTSVLEKKD